MIKSEKNIEKDLFKLISSSILAGMVSGKVYRNGMRPDGSTLEDIVVKFLAGTDGQIQTGIIVLNIYVPDITQKGFSRKVENTARTEVLEDAIIAFVESNPDTEYLYELDETPISLEVDGIDQHAIYARIKYQRLSSN